MDNARTGRRAVAWIVAGAVVIVGIVVAVALAARPSGDAAVAGSASPTAGDVCGGVADQSIALDQQVVGPEPRTCFVLAERRQVTVGAAALEPDDAVVLAVLDVDGTELGGAQSEAGWDPEVSLTLEPGTYVIEVTGTAGATPPFLIYTATFPATAEEPADAAQLPPLDACGADVPTVRDDAPVTVSAAAGESAAHYACLEIEEAGFVKVGLASAEPSDQDAPDLQLAVYRHGEQPTLVRTADDAIGLDPEMSLDLEPGTYLLEATAWFDLPTGEFEFYVDDDADLFRRGEVTSLHADATAALCADAPALAPGEAITVDGEGTYVCVTVPSDQRLTLEAATLSDQDLVLEVIGFEDSGAPYRLAFADENPYSDVLANVDPLIDQVLPAGTWLVAVTTYYTGVAADYDVAVQPAVAR
ncbi:hypothetical protein [Demequina activiva]|uniref:Uncharacterized protein n=1 Tax=Demequina activiva TaxID=1582364 RepID=A0A919UID2_9MICO|nr:hypothetical protein [Demequina activiva]GIG53276.1 hypothetical protein Dac01nite_00280 [Demequina activiva]